MDVSDRISTGVERVYDFLSDSEAGEPEEFQDWMEQEYSDIDTQQFIGNLDTRDYEPVRKSLGDETYADFVADYVQARIAIGLRQYGRATDMIKSAQRVLDHAEHSLDLAQRASADNISAELDQAQRAFTQSWSAYKDTEAAVTDGRQQLQHANQVSTDHNYGMGETVASEYLNKFAVLYQDTVGPFADSYDDAITQYRQLWEEHADEN